MLGHLDRRRSRAFVILAACVAISYSAFLTSAGTGSTARTTASCTPGAWTNFLGNGTAQGVGRSTCTNPAPCFAFDARLATNTGALLSEYKQTWATCGETGVHDFPTGVAPCRGIWVHTFFYMNINGAGTSFTNADKLCS
jgi:hypothetical protein